MSATLPLSSLSTPELSRLLPPRSRSPRRSSPRRLPALPSAAVLGAGHGGLALAGYLALAGAPVCLWNRSPGPLQGVATQGGIILNGSRTRPLRVTSSLAAAVQGVDVVLVALPASAHREVARACAPYLADDQVILLVPGRTGGALEFRRELRRHGCLADVTVGEAQTFPFASRAIGPGMANILGIKRGVPVAALPSSRTPLLLERCLPLLPMLTPATSVLHTSFENMGAMLHPVITLLNAGRIEGAGGSFRFYTDGLTSAVAAVLAAADAERCAVARAYGVPARTLQEWLADAYGGHEADLRRAVIRNPAYQEIMAPTAIDHRYLREDVPTGLVPLAELGGAAGVACPTLEGLISLTGALLGCDYRMNGRNLAALGLQGVDPAEIRLIVDEGGLN